MENPNSINFECDWRYGFNLSSRKKATVGYLLAWSGCGGLNLAQDIDVWNPYDGPGQTQLSGNKISCVGLIESFHYDGEDTDPIRISAYLSREAASSVRAKLVSPLSNTKIKLSWYIMDYDDDRKAWYEAAYIRDDEKAEGNIDSAGGELQLFVEREATKLSEQLDIGVFRMEFQVVPTPGAESDLEFATGPSIRLVKKWGSTEM